MDNIKELTFLYCGGYRSPISKVEITKHTDKSVMVGTTRLPLKDLRDGRWKVYGDYLSTTYYIPTKELEETFILQLKVCKVEAFLRNCNAHSLLKTNPKLFGLILEQL